MKKLSYVHSLAWIVCSILLVPGTVFKVLKTYFSSGPSVDYLCRVVQTGPQKEALKTAYLAEVVGLSANKPIRARFFDTSVAIKRLQASPVIKKANLKVLDHDTVYIDYTVRQPLASLYDFENVALDEEGVPFPIVPFFTPKKLPEIVLGIKAFAWNTPVRDERLQLAFNLLKMMADNSLNVLRIDVTSALESSLGKREIIVVVEESGFSKYLRLSTKDLGKQIGNYLELRKKLPLETQVIDLRIPQLGFIQSINPEKPHDSN